MLTTNDCLDWIEQRPGLVILMTEATNYLVHGVSSPLGVGFAMGGTIVNLLAVYGYIPGRKLLSALTIRLHAQA